MILNTGAKPPVILKFDEKRKKKLLFDLMVYVHHVNSMRLKSRHEKNYLQALKIRLKSQPKLNKKSQNVKDMREYAIRHHSDPVN